MVTLANLNEESVAADSPEIAEAAEVSKPVIILFSDDSTLFFAVRMRDVLLDAQPDLPVELAWYYEETALSYRQMSSLLPEGPDHILRYKELEQLTRSNSVRAIVTSRVYRPLGDILKSPMFRLSANRPCIVAFLGGLDFFPETGFERRRNCDAVYLFPHRNIAWYEAEAQANSWDVAWQEVGFGHPTFLRPQSPPEDLATRRDIYFFTQALSPSTRRGRQHMLRAMAAMARRYPDHTIWIKLRHLPSENRQHLHLERFDYPGLLAAMEDVPENLKLTACTMDEALETAALGITCTSTAVIDLVRAGIPAMVHLDFVDNYCDKLVEPMRGLFETSGLITSLDDMLNMQTTQPNPDWIEDMLCQPNLGQQVLDTIDKFQQRPFQLHQPASDDTPL